MRVGVLLAGLGVLGVGVVLLEGSPGSRVPGHGVGRGGGGGAGSSVDAVAAVRELAAEAGLPSAWGDFFALVAWRESKGNADALNDDPGEADAAREAYDRNRDRYAA
ncbi:MAG: hypothetical protein AB1Z98_18825 [Nannocystaceae bacterium]